MDTEQTVIIALERDQYSPLALLYNPNTGTFLSRRLDKPEQQHFSLDLAECTYPTISEPSRILTILSYSPDDYFIAVDNKGITLACTKDELLNQGLAITNLKLGQGVSETSISFLGSLRVTGPTHINHTEHKLFDYTYTRIHNLTNQDLGEYFARPNGGIVLKLGPTGKVRGNYIVLPGTKVLGDRALQYSELTTINLPSTLEEIGTEVFGRVATLTSIEIPSSVHAIGDGAFRYCSSLTHITLPDTLTTIPDNLFRSCSALKHITLPSTLQAIGKYAFYDNESLAEIDIPSTVTNISWTAFYGCKALKTITLPPRLTEISGDTFENCTGLIHVGLPHGLVNISTDAFRWCRALPNITLPSTLKTIASDAFSHCDNLTDIYITDLEQGSIAGAPWGAPGTPKVHWANGETETCGINNKGWNIGKTL